MDQSQILSIIKERALQNGVDPAVLARIAQIESNNNPNAGSNSSSAKGLFQFTSGTAKRYNLANPYDPAASSDAAARLLKDNAAGLGTSDPGSLYLAHFAGLGGAQKLMAADPSASAESVLGAAAVKANPFLARMSVGDVRNWASGKMGDAGSTPTTAAPQTASTAPSQPTGMLDSPATPPTDDGTEQALAAIKAIGANQPSEAPTPLPQMQIAAPQRRIDPVMLQKMLSSPLRAGFSLQG